MLRRRTIWITGVVVLSLGVVVLATRGLPEPTPDPPGAFSFAVLGDAPSHVWEEVQYRLVLRALDAHDLGFVLHVGDIFWRPCTDERYERTLDGLNGLRHAVIYTPGDNEWTDCWEPGSGGYAPRERLERIRQIFFADPTRTLGGSTLPLIRQSSGGTSGEFVENARFTHRGIVFATVHLVGSRNGLDPFAGRTSADDDEVHRRTEAAAGWVRETFAEARSVDAPAVVLGFHANPALEAPAGDPFRQAFEPFLTALEEEVENFARPVLAVHGDHHDFVVDRPLVRRPAGPHLDNFTRLQVPGSPRVGWVRVVVTPDAAEPFAFQEHVVPRWKYW
jgi:hypothetical protein